MELRRRKTIASKSQPKIDQTERALENEAAARVMPGSPLDLQMLTIDSMWGMPEVSQELKERLARYYREQGIDAEGNPQMQIKKESMWGMMSYFTRDMRLANLSSWDNEIQTVRYMIELAGDFLDANMVEPFLMCLSHAATILETSQSKGGFFRKISNTFRKEETTQALEPPKKGFFGGKKEGN